MTSPYAVKQMYSFDLDSAGPKHDRLDYLVRLRAVNVNVVVCGGTLTGGRLEFSMPGVDDMIFINAECQRRPMVSDMSDLGPIAVKTAALSGKWSVTINLEYLPNSTGR